MSDHIPIEVLTGDSWESLVHASWPGEALVVTQNKVTTGLVNLSRLKIVDVRTMDFICKGNHLRVSFTQDVEVEYNKAFYCATDTKRVIALFRHLSEKYDQSLKRRDNKTSIAVPTNVYNLLLSMTISNPDSSTVLFKAQISKRRRNQVELPDLHVKAMLPVTAVTTREILLGAKVQVVDGHLTNGSSDAYKDFDNYGPDWETFALFRVVRSPYDERAVLEATGILGHLVPQTEFRKKHTRQRSSSAPLSLTGPMDAFVQSYNGTTTTTSTTFSAPSTPSLNGSRRKLGDVENDPFPHQPLPPVFATSSPYYSPNEHRTPATRSKTSGSKRSMVRSGSKKESLSVGSSPKSAKSPTQKRHARQSEDEETAEDDSRFLNEAFSQNSSATMETPILSSQFSEPCMSPLSLDTCSDTPLTSASEYPYQEFFSQYTNSLPFLCENALPFYPSPPAAEMTTNQYSDDSWSNTHSSSSSLSAPSLLHFECTNFRPPHSQIDSSPICQELDRERERRVPTTNPDAYVPHHQRRMP